MDQQEHEVQGPSLRESIKASIDNLEKSGDTEGAVHQDTTPAAGATAVPAKEGTVPGISKASTGKPAAIAAEGAAVEVTKPDVAKPAASITDTPARPAAVRGPASWRPEVREKWAALPTEVQAEVTRREREIATALQETATVRQFAEAFRDTITPYQNIIALEGNDPLKTFESYMKTATVLRTGSPFEKADAIANAIASFGIDISMLDNLLTKRISGQPVQAPHSQQAQQVQTPDQYRDPRVDELFSYLQTQQVAREEAVQLEVQTELEAFASDPKNEFFEDLRADIADVLRISANRGHKVSLQEAYDKAAKLHPEISKVVLQREAAKNAAQRNQAIATKRLAGSSIASITPRQTGTQNNAPSSVRDSIEGAIQQLNG